MSRCRMLLTSRPSTAQPDRMRAAAAPCSARLSSNSHRMSVPGLTRCLFDVVVEGLLRIRIAARSGPPPERAVREGDVEVLDPMSRGEGGNATVAHLDLHHGDAIAPAGDRVHGAEP